MNVWQSIFFGLIQGFTEFLPVSSSGHLLLVSALTGVECPLFMSVMLHVGTLFAVIIAYRKPLLQILRHPIHNGSARLPRRKPPATSCPQVGPHRCRSV